MTNNINEKNRIGSYQNIFFATVVVILSLLILLQLYSIYKFYKEEDKNEESAEEEYQWSDEMKEDVQQKEDYLNRIMQEAVE